MSITSPYRSGIKVPIIKGLRKCPRRGSLARGGLIAGCVLGCPGFASDRSKGFIVSEMVKHFNSKGFNVDIFIFNGYSYALPFIELRYDLLPVLIDLCGRYGIDKKDMANSLGFRGMHGMCFYGDAKRVKWFIKGFLFERELSGR